MNNLKPILYAEDEEDDGFILERAFGRAGICNPLVVVPTGTEAIRYLSGVGDYADRTRYPLPCLVLVDLNMPGTSGLDVLKWIRSTPSTATLVVIVITSSGQDQDVHRAYLIGANGFVVKPSNLEDVVVMAKSIKDYWLSQNRGASSTHISAEGQKSDKPPGEG
jgi:CheY-like chemotaxis protein